MNELRTAIVGLVAVVVGFAGAWFVLGARSAQLAKENDDLRRHGHQARPVDVNPSSDLGDPASLQRKLIGRWATVVQKSRLGRINLIFDLQTDGTVRWESTTGSEATEIASGAWKLEPGGIHFAVTIVDPRSPDKGLQRATTAKIVDLIGACLTLEVDGVEWEFFRTT
jgi:hypothetical protein